MENLDPPPPQIKDGKMARFYPSRGLGGDGGLLFHFILSKIVVTSHGFYLSFNFWFVCQ